MMQWVPWRCCGNLSPPLSSSLLSGSWSPCFGLFVVLGMMDEEPYHKTGSSYIHPKASLQVQRHTFPPCAPQAQSGGAISHGLGLQNSPFLVIYTNHFAIVMESWLDTLGSLGSMLGMASSHRAIMYKLFPRNKCFSRWVHSVVLEWVIICRRWHFNFSLFFILIIVV